MTVLRDEDFARLTPPWDELARPIAASFYGAPELQPRADATPAAFACSCGTAFTTPRGLLNHSRQKRCGP